MKRHSVPCPEGNKGAELVAKLRYRAYKAPTKLRRCTLSDIKIGSDIYAAKAETTILC